MIDIKEKFENSFKEPCPFELDVIPSTCEKGYVFGAHYHNHIEFLYGVEGSLYINCGDDEYHLKKNDFILINPDVIHYTVGEEEVNKYVCFKASPSILYKATKKFLDTNYFLPFIIQSNAYPTFFPSEIIEKSTIPKVFSEMISETEEKNYGYELSVLSDAYKIFIWILRYWQKNGFSESEEMDKEKFEAYQKIQDYVHKNYRNNISVKELSRYCNMSYSSFYSFFKKTMGQNFTDYLTKIRISEAEKLLATTQMPISQISKETGFATSSYFVSQFKKIKKITPKQFRTQYKT